MTNTTKMTKLATFKQILSHLTDENEIAVMTREIALLEKQKANRSAQMTDTQKENLQTMTEIVAWMGSLPNKSATIADIRKHFGLTAQKVVPMMNKLNLEGTVSYTVEKKVKVYTLA